MTPRQSVILDRMRTRRVHDHGAETGAEMVEALWVTGAFTSYEQGQRTCKQLVAKGYFCELGFGPNNARCYGLAGRDDITSKEAET